MILFGQGIISSEQSERSGGSYQLQQHYQNTHSSTRMRSATLKGLALHSADEAGSADGPDYIYGWGLMNAERAAELISLDSDKNNESMSKYCQMEVSILELFNRKALIHCV